MQLEVSVDETLDPTAESGSEPRDFSAGRISEPILGHTEIEHLRDRLNQQGSHNNGTINGQNHIMHRLAHNVQHRLELFDFLSQEDVERHVFVGVETLGRGHGRQFLLVVKFDEVFGESLDELLLELLLNFLFLGFAAGTTTLFGHGVNERVKHLLGFLETESKIGGVVETKDGG